MPKHHEKPISKQNAPRVSSSLALAFLVAATWYVTPTAHAAQAGAEVSPEATPEIRQLSPSDIIAGSETTIKISGSNFSRGAYVSFSNPGVRVISVRRISATELETQVAAGEKVQPDKASLYVSNPAGAAAETQFSITTAAAEPATPVTPAVQSAPLAPAESEPPNPSAPVITAVDPLRAALGGELPIKVKGKNFAQGTKIAFSNPGIRVLEITISKATELTARIRVASDAATGKTSLFVVNPDDSEAEAQFEVADGATATAKPAAPSAPTSPTAPAGSKGTAQKTALRFDVYNLGEAVILAHTPTKAKGTLTFTAGKLEYEEEGNEIFSSASSEIQEVGMNTYFGVKTPVFHVILTSGKTYNFIAPTLQTPDSETIVDSLRKALH